MYSRRLSRSTTTTTAERACRRRRRRDGSTRREVGIEQRARSRDRRDRCGRRMAWPGHALPGRYATRPCPPGRSSAVGAARHASAAGPPSPLYRRRALSSWSAAVVRAPRPRSRPSRRHASFVVCLSPCSVHPSVSTTTNARAASLSVGSGPRALEGKTDIVHTITADRHPPPSV